MAWFIVIVIIGRYHSIAKSKCWFCETPFIFSLDCQTLLGHYSIEHRFLSTTYFGFRRRREIRLTIIISRRASIPAAKNDAAELREDICIITWWSWRFSGHYLRYASGFRIMPFTGADSIPVKAVSSPRHFARWCEKTHRQQRRDISMMIWLRLSTPWLRIGPPSPLLPLSWEFTSMTLHLRIAVYWLRRIRRRRHILRNGPAMPAIL